MVVGSKQDVVLLCLLYGGNGSLDVFALCLSAACNRVCFAQRECRLVLQLQLCASQADSASWELLLYTQHGKLTVAANGERFLCIQCRLSHRSCD